MNKNSEINEKLLFDRVKNGEKEAFSKLYEIYAPRIYQFSISYLKNQIDSEELVHEVFLKIWEKKSFIDTSKNVKSYIFKIAVNEIYMFIRKRNIEKTFQEYVLNNYQIDENNTWHSLILNDMLNNLSRLVDQLPEQQKKIFHLSKEMGLSNDEIAEKLNLSKRTVENHLYRAISFIKKAFDKDTLIAILFINIWLG